MTRALLHSQRYARSGSRWGGPFQGRGTDARQLAAASPTVAQGPGAFIPLEMRGMLARALSGTCDGIVKQMTQAAGRNDADAMAVLGWMHERGFCVAADVGKAFDFYEAAYRHGQTRVTERLAGLSASPEGGRDLVATLWWARRSERRSTLLQEALACDPVPGKANPTEDEFVDALKDWSQTRRLQCLADVGFRAMLLADMRYTVEALKNDMEGNVTVTFDLHRGASAVKASHGAGPALTTYVEQVVAHAMPRAPRSPVARTDKIDFVFRLTY